MCKGLRQKAATRYANSKECKAEGKGGKQAGDTFKRRVDVSLGLAGL